MMLCMSTDGQHSIMQRAGEGSEETWVLEAVARCRFMHSPLLAGAVQSQECDATRAMELSSRVVPLMMFSSCDVPSESLMEVQLQNCASPMEQLMDVEQSDVVLKATTLPNKGAPGQHTVIPIDAEKDVILVDKQIGNLSDVSASLDVSVTKLPRTNLKHVSVPTDKQEMPVCPLENGIRPSNTDTLISTVHTVNETEETYNTPLPIIRNDSDSPRSIQDADLLTALRDLEQHCKKLKEENIILRKSSFPETEEKVKRLKKKNAELAVIAKRLEERAQKLQEANLKMVNTPMHLKGAGLEMCRKAFACQRAKDMSEQASALLAKDKQIEALKQECQELHAKLSAGKDVQSWLKLDDFNRLLHESQKEVLRLQRQIAMKYLKDSLHLSRSESPKSLMPAEVKSAERCVSNDQQMECQDNNVQEVELRRKRKECESLDQEVKKKQKKCEELESKIQEVQSKNACLVEENTRLCFRVKRTAKVELENADLKRHLAEVTEQRDSALKESHRLQSKLENLEQVLKHMRDVAERRQQLEKDHEDAVSALQKRQEEVKRLQQAQVEAKKEHEGAVQLLENTLDTLQAKVKLLEEKCRSQTEQFSLLSEELERFRLQTGNIDLLTCTLGTSELPPPQGCSTPGLNPAQQDRGDLNESVLLKLEEKSKVEEEKQLPETPVLSHNVNHTEIRNHAVSKDKQKPEVPQISSKSESTHESSKSCPTPEVDTASEMEDLDADSVSLNPEPEIRPTAKLQVFLARYSYNPFDGPNENPEAELPLTAGEYIYIYGDMDDDGFYEGELMDGRRGLVPSNFVERVSDDDLIAFHPGEANELSQSSGKDISFLSGSSIERSEEDDDGSSLSPLPMQGNSEGTADVSAVPYPRKLTLIKQLARSIVVGWEPPLVAAGSANILSYNIYVDNELRQNVRCGGQTKSLIEKLELKTRTYRISVQSMTENGGSDRMRCTILVGYGYSLAPTQLRVRSLSATSAEITWQPCNSNYSHALYLNEESCGLAKPGTYWYTFSSLRPSTMYNVKVEARPQRIPLELPIERREPKTTVMQLTTPAAGPPDAPLDVQVELGPKPGVLLITWLPVTIDAAGTSNGVRVTGYAVYADGQKVLEVTSPTAGSVLLGMSHLQLLQVSREISVKTMSPSGESVDSVPAQIPSAFIKFPDSPSLSNNFSNTIITASGQNICSQSETFPTSPLTSSSPCTLHNSADAKTKFTIRTGCNTVGSVETMRTLPHIPISPLSASSSYCQGSSSSEPSEVQVSSQGTQDNVPSSLPEALSLPFPTKTLCNSLEATEMQARVTAVQDESQKCSDTKEYIISDQATSGLPITWDKENNIQVNTVAKEDCSSPETVVSEDTDITTSGVNCRGASIEDFLEVVKKDQKLSETNLSSEVEDVGELLSDTHSDATQIDHSRSSNLSDILEEEEDEENDLNGNHNIKNWGQSSARTGADSAGKLECCETDSDEEILERILDLPLQKHCSKKLFSIPEVTEEEEDEENLSLPVISKTPHCNMEAQKYQYMKAYEALPQKPVVETSVSLPTCCKDINANRKSECAEENCPCADKDWINSKSCISYSSPDFVKLPASESLTWNTKKNNHVSDKSYYITEGNRKKQNDGREHCSRLATNSSQASVNNSRSNNQKEHVAYCAAREMSSKGHRSTKSKLSRSDQRRHLHGPTKMKTKTSGSLSTRHLEIDVEYDTEDEEEEALSSPAHYSSRNKVDLWGDSSQTDREVWSESSGHSEPIQYTRRKKEMKNPIKAHAVETDNIKGNPHVLHIGKIYGSQPCSSRVDKNSRATSNTILRTAWNECPGKAMFDFPIFTKDDWSEEPLVSTPLAAKEMSSDWKGRISHLTSDAAHSNQPNYCTENALETREDSSKKQKEESIRIFVALFDYDPVTMSPNPDAYMEELPFKEGQILQVFGDKDTDGFYRGKYEERTGYIPCNMVSELHIESEEVRRQLLRQGHLTSASLLNDLVQLTSVQEEKAAEKHVKTRNPDVSSSRPMVAIFDYNPRESSPNPDIEAELSFNAGDVITVFGQMDEDGFYYGELNGRRGLVPSNYLEISQTPTEDTQSRGAVPVRGAHKRAETEFNFDIVMDQPCVLLNESSPSDHAVVSREASEKEPHQGITYTPKKKSFFSKGKKLFKKLGSTGKSV